MNPKNPGINPWQEPQSEPQGPSSEVVELGRQVEIGGVDDLEACSDVGSADGSTNVADHEVPDPPEEAADWPTPIHYGTAAVRGTVEPSTPADETTEVSAIAEATEPAGRWFEPDQFDERDLTYDEKTEASSLTDQAVDKLFVTHNDYVLREASDPALAREMLEVEYETPHGVLRVLAHRTLEDGSVHRRLRVQHEPTDPEAVETWDVYVHADDADATTHMTTTIDDGAEALHEEIAGPRQMAYVSETVAPAQPPVVSGVELVKEFAEDWPEYPVSVSTRAEIIREFAAHAEAFGARHDYESVTSIDEATGTAMKMEIGLASDYDPAGTDTLCVSVSLIGPVSAPWVDPMYSLLQRTPHDAVLAELRYEVTADGKLVVTGQQCVQGPDGERYFETPLGSPDQQISPDAFLKLRRALRKPTAVK